MATTSETGVQVDLETVQRKRFSTPGLNPLTSVLGSLGSVKVPVPASTVHAPLSPWPASNSSAFKVVEVAQRVWSFPAEVMGLLTRVILKLVLELVQLPLLSVHVIVWVPSGRLLIVVLAAVISPNWIPGSLADH